MPHYGLVIYIIKNYLRAKEELWKLKYFSTHKKICKQKKITTQKKKKKKKKKNLIFEKIPLKETKILQEIITLYN